MEPVEAIRLTLLEGDVIFFRKDRVHTVKDFYGVQEVNGEQVTENIEQILSLLGWEIKDPSQEAKASLPICYKTNEPCIYNCPGQCRESC